MFKAFRIGMRQVIPLWPLVTWALISFGTQAIIFALFFYAVRWQLPNDPIDIWTKVSDLDLLRTDVVMLAFGAIAYGIYRGVYFQPYAMKQYKAWLLTTPWDHPAPLPLGPTHIVWQDLVALLILCVPICWMPASMLLVVAAFLFGLILAQQQMLFESNQSNLMFLESGLIVGNLLVPELYLVYSGSVTLVLVYGILAYGRTNAIRDLRTIAALEESSTTPEIGVSSSPFGYAIGPVEAKTWTPKINLTVAGMFSCWATFCVISKFEAIDSVEINGMIRYYSGAFAFCVSLLLALFRLMEVKYCWSPISFWGRFRTRRWVMPRYDVIFVAPAGLIAVAAVGCCGIWLTEIPIALSVTALLAIQFSLTAALPPNPEVWRLTGECRIGEEILNTGRTKGEVSRVGIRTD